MPCRSRSGALGYTIRDSFDYDGYVDYNNSNPVKYGYNVQYLETPDKKECKLTNKRFLFIIMALIFPCTLAFPQSNDTLWYNQPAKFFEEALVIGSGKTGATVFGGVQSDKIYLNDATLCSGGPVDPNENPDVSSLIPQVREALAGEDYRTAERLNRRIEGKFSESFSPLGTLIIDHKQQADATNYYRELDMTSME